MPSRPMFTTPDALGPQAAEAGQADRHRQPQRRAERCRSEVMSLAPVISRHDGEQHEQPRDAEQPERPAQPRGGSCRRAGAVIDST